MNRLLRAIAVGILTFPAIFKIVHLVNDRSYIVCFISAILLSTLFSTIFNISKLHAKPLPRFILGFVITIPTSFVVVSNFNDRSLLGCMFGAAAISSLFAWLFASHIEIERVPA